MGAPGGRCLEGRWPALLGLNEPVAKGVPGRSPSARLTRCSSWGRYERGRAAAFASDTAPHWAPPGFMQWQGWRVLFEQLVSWLAREGLPQPADLAATAEAR